MSARRAGHRVKRHFGDDFAAVSAVRGHLAEETSKYKRRNASHSRKFKIVVRINDE